MIVIVNSYEIRQVLIGDHLPCVYQLVQHTQIGEKILFESEDLREVIEELHNHQKANMQRVGKFKELMQTALHIKPALTIKNTITIK